MTTSIITNADFTRAAIALANAARLELLILQYLFVVDGPCSRPMPRIARALRDAADRGVSIRILLNRFSHGRSPGDFARRLPEALTHPNVHVRYHTHGQVLHCKVIIADGTTTLIGSHNLTDWGMARSQNVSLELVDADVASGLLSIYNPLWDAADHATS